VTLRAQDNRDLQFSFPKSLREEVLQVVSVLPENPHSVGNFTVKVSGELLSILRRVYHNTSLIHTERLSSLQRELIDCILTRHHDGFVRQRSLSAIISSNNAWVPPFVIQLLGEYVIEITCVIDKHLRSLDASLYARFLEANQDFLALTEKRVVSYWDCYYRSVRREDYVGFRVLGFFKNLLAKTN
jgi:hypothetical protein